MWLAVHLTLFMTRCMMVLGVMSLVVLFTIFMYESTRFLIVSTCLSSWGSRVPWSSLYNRP